VRARVHTFPDIREASSLAADDIFETARASVGRDGFFSWALSGGRSPGILFRLMGRPPYAVEMPWGDTHLFWCDERFVPPGHGDSNFRLAKEAFIDHVPIPAENVHRIRTEYGSPEEAARAYEREVRGFFAGMPGSRDEIPSLHLALLGLGGDGHTASLFPGDDALDEKERLVVASRAPHGVTPADRITMTYPLLNRARRVLFLVSGGGKRPVVEGILNEAEAASAFPASRIRPGGELRWYVGFHIPE